MSFRDSMNAVLEGTEYIRNQGEIGTARKKRNALASLTGQFYGGQVAPEERGRFLGDVANAGGDPANFQKEAFTRAGQRAAMVLEAPDELKQQYYEPLAREMHSLGFPVPTTFDPASMPMLAKFAQQHAGGGAPGNSVQSTYIDADGNRVGIMRDGTTQVLGKNAPNNQIIAADGGYYGVNKGNLSAAPVTMGAPQQAPQQPAQDANTMASLMELGQIPGVSMSSGPRSPSHNAKVGGKENSQHLATAGDYVMPPHLQASFIALVNKNPDLMAIPEGDHIHVQQRGAVTSGGQLQPAVKPTNPNDAARLEMERERLRLSQNADSRAATAASKPPALSAAERKDMLARRAKIPQLQNTVRGMDRIKAALGKLSGGLVNTGPMDQGVQKFTKEGQELDSAVGAIQNSMLSLTRVPGIGSQSDLEARIAALQYPSLDKAPEVNARTMQQLESFVTDLATAYQVAAESDRDVATGAQKPAPAAEFNGFKVLD